MPRSKLNLSKVLIDSGKITAEQLEKALFIQRKAGRELKEILINEGILSEDELLSVISYHLNIPFVDPSRYEIDPKIIATIPEDLARKHVFFPLYKIGKTLLIAVAEPLDILTIDNLRLSLGCEVKQVLAKEQIISDCINTFYSDTGTQSLPGILKYEGDQEEALEIIRVKKTEDEESADLIQESQKEPIIEAVNRIVGEAIAKRASDIHLEPGDEDLTIRYRIDGILHKIYSLPKKTQRGIAARIKILSNLDITRFYIPQDGRFSLNTKGKQLDFRVSSLPTIYGEKFVLRILDKSSITVKLQDLGFSEHSFNLLKEGISKDHGMILVTGPTGSGKSTTLYAVLNELNKIHRHIVTVEDPVEYQLDGIGQTQIRSDIDFTFATALRGILRQSPDIIMVGEIRDAETADIAIKASLIGQLILSTLHTNDSVSAFARLIDMGVERYLVASSLILICAQRLCRKICSNCKEPVETPPANILKELGIAQSQEMKFYAGRGCSVCYNTGYKGRIALLEAFLVDDIIRSMVIQEKPLEEIREMAIKEGRLITLRSDGIIKAAAGITTIEEIYRVTAND
ncbi:MAG: GspE/PulE family protein [Candidatus Omnitrophica bacterium]|jgi:type IV pilus assembly protein PilB|nr:GspE/PulE family protein [Candidatus Omnitrophota bacterium]